MKIKILIGILVIISLSAFIYFGGTLLMQYKSLNNIKETTETNESQIEEEKDKKLVEEEIPPENLPDDEFVDLQTYIPSAIIDLKYATADNFTGEVIYTFKKCYLKYGTVKKLKMVQQELDKYKYRMKIWDGYRPFEAQEKLWEVYPDGNFVANPSKGYTSHNLGNTVDMTLTDKDGNELEMPTTFDDFSAKADRDYSDVSKEAGENAQFLEDIMVKNGFKGYKKEWWHYEDVISYEAEPDFIPPE